jgi:predicted ATPase
MLVSSREALNIRAEQRLLIGGMEIESAVNLFLQAANKILPDYEAKEADQLVIREICHLVGGVPLAVEISAAWVKMMDVINIARQIKASVDFLETRWQDVPERHRSMKIIFEESWQLLSPSEQKALAKISIFKGGFSLNAVVTITGASLNEIAGLLDKSLVEHPGKSRYKVHELLRQFAQIKSNEMSNEADIEAPW